MVLSLIFCYPCRFIISASMFYEVRKSLIGFRLKIVFHPVLKKESTYVYVDIRESPTVGALLTNIAARFGISENLAISLHNLTVWTCENILVLADVDEVKYVLLYYSYTAHEIGCNHNDICTYSFLSCL